MPNTFSELEIELFCPTCGTEWEVPGKQLLLNRDVPCPACGEITRVDVFGFHAAWARIQKAMSKL